MTNNVDIKKAEKLFFESLEYQKVGNFSKSKENLLEALKLCPGRESIINNLIIILFALEESDTLEKLLEEQNIINQNHLNLINIYILYLRKRFRDCINISLESLNSNLGNNDQIIDILIKSFFKLKDSKKVFKFMRLSLRSRNFLDQKYYVIGLMLFHLGKPQPAKVFFDKAISINKSKIYLYAKALALLKLREFKNGFELLENRFYNYDQKLIFFKNIPQIEDLNKIVNKKVVVWYEQGLGDTLNFLKYILLLKNFTNQITFVVQDSLIDLLNNFDHDIKIKSYLDAENESFDFQIPLFSLVKKLDCNLQKPIKLKINLSSNANKVDFDSKNLHIAFSYSGNPNYFCDHYRSIDFDKFKKILNVNNIHYYKLNKSPLPNDVDKNEYTSTDLSHLNIYDIALLLNKFDLIISTDTVFAHLCGILNINCILLLSKNSDWRWFDDDKKTIWHESIRIVKQSNLDDWDKILLLINRFLRLKSFQKQKKLKI